MLCAAAHTTRRAVATLRIRQEWHSLRCPLRGTLYLTPRMASAPLPVPRHFDTPRMASAPLPLTRTQTAALPLRSTLAKNGIRAAAATHHAMPCRHTLFAAQDSAAQESAGAQDSAPASRSGAQIAPLALR